MRGRAKVVVVGGGVAGCSLAYHLARLGCTDVVLLERDELTSGSTWHAAGLCTQFNQSYNVMALLRRSVELYGKLGDQTGQEVDYHCCGSVRIATSEDRLHQFQHVAGIAANVGVPFEIVTAEQASMLFPLMVPDGVLAAAYLPTDGHVDPSGLTQAFARGAAALGVEIVRHAPVTTIDRRGATWILSTSGGDVEADIVVNAAGQWANEVAAMLGHRLPLVSMEHQYVVTEPLSEVAGREVELPVFRDPDSSFYCRQEHGGLLVGPFEHNPKPWALEGIPDGFASRLLPPDLDQIEDSLAAAGRRIPAFADAGIRTVVNGPDAYTPDGRCLMGFVPGARNVFVLAGFSIFGIVFGGGAGAYAAEWIVDGQPSDSMWDLDVRRFGPYANSTGYVVERAVEVFEDEYKIHFPEEERPAGRPLKTDPIHERLVDRGAVMGVRFGWERPLWFARNGKARDEYTFRRGNWFATVGGECRAVRSAVGVLDQTSFAKFFIDGPGAERFLDRLCANRLPAETGRICLTQALTPKGGIECDLTVTRVEPERFYVVSAAATETHDLAWIERHAPEDGTVCIENATARYGVLTLAGPRSRELLQRLSRDDLSAEAFPFFRARHLEVGRARVLALRVSYVGELGYELHHPLEQQRYLYDLVVDAGEDLGLVDFGYRALDSMRLEKGYRLWGADITADYSPLEAGLERFVALDKNEFIGRKGIMARGEPRIRLSTIVVDADGADAHGYEPVYAGSDLVTYAMAGGYGHTVGKSIALAYLPLELAAEGTELGLEILGERRRARVAADVLYDPRGDRLRS
ncbi:MAG TPA: FAD-dependent oxidoreductase [Gaiellaceae bacterium]|nr:FAD-dependent oxidoreductase [Gaiellaceae bacterium]